MTMHLAWIRVTAAAATTIATFGGQLAVGQSQYGPYAPAPQYYSAPAPQYSTTPQYAPAQQYTTAPQYAPAPQRVAPYGVPQAQPVQATQSVAYPTTSPSNYYTAARPGYAPAQQPAAAPASDARYATTAPAPPSITPSNTPASAQYQPPRYQQPTYPSLAQQPNGTVTPGTSELQPQPAEGLPTPANGNSAMPSPSTDSYFGNDAAAMGYNTGSYNSGGYNSGSYNPAAEGYAGCGIEGCDECDSGSRWYGGVYGLYMTRSQPSYRPYTAGIDSAATGTPYYPQPGDIENESDCTYLVPDWREGVEVRIGCAFGTGGGCADSGYGTGTSACGGDACGCEPCCQPCCQQYYAVEAAWWGIDRDVQDQFVDGPLTANFRYYGMINYAGLEYDPGGGAQGVNDFYNYQVPVTGPGAETVLAQRVRTNFSAQNLELNMLRLPLSMGCGCDGCPEAFSLTGLCGVRYFSFDDDFEFGTEWDDGNPFDGWRNGTNELFHDIQMQNQLLGFQLGANMNYCVASRWNFFWDTNFGVYNNHVTQFQQMYNPLVGNVTFAQDGREFSVNSSKNDVAFLGEMRLGGGFLITQHWRGVLAYRAVAISGVALAPDQIRPEYNSWADTARINADGSIIIHGVQAGVECNF